MNHYDCCNILVLDKEDICEELKEFIQPKVKEITELYKQPRCGGRQGAKFFASHDVSTQPGFDKLSDLAKQQYADHCKRISEKLDWESIEHDPD